MTRIRLAICLALLVAAAAPAAPVVAQEIPQEYIHAGSTGSRFVHKVKRAPRALAKGIGKVRRAIGKGVKKVARPFHRSGPTFTAAEFSNDPYGGIPEN